MHSGADIASNVAKSAWTVVQNSINWVAWTVLPEKWAQVVQDIQNQVSQGAQNLGKQAREKLQEWWEKAKWFFAWLRKNFRDGFAPKNAKEIMQQASAPVEQPQNMPQSSTVPVVDQPTTPVVDQPTTPVVEQPNNITPEVTLWDKQEPTETKMAA